MSTWEERMSQRAATRGAAQRGLHDGHEQWVDETLCFHCSCGWTVPGAVSVIFAEGDELEGESVEDFVAETERRRAALRKRLGEAGGG